MFLILIIFIGFLAILAIAYERAILEEELLASQDAFGQDYRDYIKKTKISAKALALASVFTSNTI